MSLVAQHDGYYDDAGEWHRTKLCFVDCGERCTCKPPMAFLGDKDRLKEQIAADKYPEPEAGHYLGDHDD